MDFKQAPMYIEIIEQKLWMKKLKHDPPLEIKYKAFKKPIFSCAKKYFGTKYIKGINIGRSQSTSKGST